MVIVIVIFGGDAEIIATSGSWGIQYMKFLVAYCFFSNKGILSLPAYGRCERIFDNNVNVA